MLNGSTHCHGVYHLGRLICSFRLQLKVLSNSHWTLIIWCCFGTQFLGSPCTVANLWTGTADKVPNNVKPDCRLNVHTVLPVTTSIRNRSHNQLTTDYNKHNTVEDKVHEAAVTKSDGRRWTDCPPCIRLTHGSLHWSQCSTMVDEMMPPPLLLADGVEAIWLSLGTFTAHDIDDNASSHNGAIFPTPTDDTELWDSVSPPPDGLVPTTNGSSGLDDDEDSGIGLNISVVESAASGMLLNAVALSASSSLSSFSPSATKRMQRFFRLSTLIHVNTSTEHARTLIKLTLWWMHYVRDTRVIRQYHMKTKSAI